PVHRTVTARRTGTAHPSGPPPAAARPASPQALRRLLADAGEQVVLEDAVAADVTDQAAGELVVLGRPGLLLDLHGDAEPEPVRVDLGGVRPQRLVPHREVL